MIGGTVNHISYGSFFLWLLGGGDSAHHFETPVGVSFEILTSFEMIPQMRHGRRPRMKKIECLAEKIMGREIDRFSKIEGFVLCKFCF